MGNGELMQHLKQCMDSIQDKYQKSLNSKGIITEEPIPSSDGLSNTSNSVHPISCKAWDMFLEINVATVEPTELANILDLLVENLIFADTYLLLAKDPKCLAAGQRVWIDKWLEELRQ